MDPDTYNYPGADTTIFYDMEKLLVSSYDFLNKRLGKYLY